MIEIIYTASFIRELKRIGEKNTDLLEEILEKIKLFGNRKNHRKLKTHKLHGKLSDYWSFSANYKFRILYRVVSRDRVIFHDVGDHEIYK